MSRPGCIRFFISATTDVSACNTLDDVLFGMRKTVDQGWMMTYRMPGKAPASAMWPFEYEHVVSKRPFRVLDGCLA